MWFGCLRGGFRLFPYTGVQSPKPPIQIANWGPMVFAERDLCLCSHISPLSSLVSHVLTAAGWCSGQGRGRSDFRAFRESKGFRRGKGIARSFLFFVKPQLSGFHIPNSQNRGRLESGVVFFFLPDLPLHISQETDTSSKTHAATCTCHWAF